MARKADIQYIQHYYTAGNTAKKLAVAEAPKKAPLPFFEPRMLEPDQKITVAVDPLAVGSIVIAAVLVVMMVVSLLQFGTAHQQQVELQEYVYTLTNENLALTQTYEASYDLDQIEAQALALGMVPADQVQTMTITGSVPTAPAAPTFWENMQMVFGELFANVEV